MIVPAPRPSQVDTDQKLPKTLQFPGREYKSGAGWWTLTCASTCQVARTRLRVTSQRYSLQNGAMVPGQSLQWSPMPLEGSVLFFKTPARVLRPVAGSIKTYRLAETSTDALQEPAGTAMEVEFLMTDGGKAQLAPVLVLPNPKAVRSSALFSLELRIKGQRQTLIDNSFNPEDFFSNPTSYVPWIGDLDGDGKSDLVLNTNPSSSCGTSIVLFLSSLAKPGEISGEAGRFDLPPAEDKGC